MNKSAANTGMSIVPFFSLALARVVVSRFGDEGVVTREVSSPPRRCHCHRMSHAMPL